MLLKKQNPQQDPAEVPLDGLVLADVIGQINLPNGVLALYTVEVGPPRVDVGNIDPIEP